MGRYTDGKPCHIANYYDQSGERTHQQIRLRGKEFRMIGGGDAPLYGMWLWSGKGRSITATTGLLDALSVSQAFGHKYPVVSLPNGDKSVEKAIAASYDFLTGYDTICLMFDMDKSGRAACDVAAAMLPPEKVRIASLKHKDPNDVLRADGPGAIVRAFWDAAPWRPDGIVHGSELTREKIKQAIPPGFPHQWPQLQGKTYGIRKGEITLWTAGSGIGKSTVVRECAYHLATEHECSIGNVFLEEGNAKTAQAYVAIHNSVPLGKLRFQPDLLSDEQWDTGLAAVVHDRMWFYNHFGSLESGNLLSKLRYLATVCKVDFICLDHISIVTSGIESSSEGERKDIDILMTRLRSLVEETGVGVIAIVHLKRVPGKVYNEGAQVSLSDLRGSGSLEQLSDNVYALERDQQADEAGERTRALIRVLKCREVGDLGPADYINYNTETGRYELAQAPKGDTDFSL